MGRSGSEFLYLKEKFPRKTDAKVRKAIIFKDLEKPQWKFLKNVVNFLDNHKSVSATESCLVISYWLIKHWVSTCYSRFVF